MLQQINRHEFVNTIIGEGSTDIFRAIFNDNDNEKFDSVMGEFSEEFEHVLNKNMSKMSVYELTALAKRYSYNVEVIELTTETKEDLLF